MQAPDRDTTPSADFGLLLLETYKVRTEHPSTARPSYSIRLVEQYQPY